MKKTINNNSFGMKRFRMIFGVLVAILALFANSQTNAQTYYDMSSGNYSQNFNGITTLPTNFSLVGVLPTGTIPVATRTTTTSTNLLAVVVSGAAVGIDVATSTRLVFLTTGATANTTAIASDLNLNFAGRTAGNLSYDASTIFNSTGNRVGSLRVYYSLDNIAWTELTGTNLPYVATNNVVGSGSVNIVLPGALNNQATVKLRFYYHNGTPNGTTGSRPRIGIDNLAVTSTPAAGPTLTWLPTSLTGFSTTFPAASTSQISQVSGASLSPSAGNLTITAPTNFQVFDDITTFSWVASYTIPYTGGALALTDVSARIAPSASVGAVLGNVTAAGGGATTINLAVSGTVIGPLITIVTGATTNKFHANQGQYSDAQLITISGAALSTSTTITSPANFEVSTTSATTGFGNTATITTTPTYTNVNVWVRISQAAAFGTYSAANVTFASTGATTQNVSVNGQKYANTVAFTPGNLLMLRIGDGTLALSSAAQPVFLDEYTNAGTLIQTLAMPMTDFGSNKKFSISGTSTLDGVMNLSPDGKFLTLTGYNATNIYQLAITGTTVATVQRLVALIDFNGNVNTSTRLNAYSAGNIRGGVTVGGGGFWTTGNTGSPGSLCYTPFGNDGTGVVPINTTWNCRSVAIANSNLFISRQSQIGFISGLPTTAVGDPTTIITGLADAFNFVVLDVDAGIAGPDLIYVANGTGGLLKYSFNGSAWTARGNRTGNCSSITARKNEISGNIDIYLNSVFASSPNSIYYIEDVAAFNANITGTTTAITTSTLVKTSDANTIFRSVAFAPIFVATPEVVHTFTSPAPFTAPQGAANKAIYRIQCDITIGNAILTDVTVQTAGAYGATDINNFKLIISNDATLDGGDIILGTISTSTGPGQILAFTGLGQNLPISTSRYLFITASVAGCAILTNTINITSTALTAINYSNGATVKTGTPVAGNTNTITIGNLADVTSLAASSGAPQVAISWVNPPSCITEVIVVAHTSPILGTPVGTYTGNTNYAVAPAFSGGGKVVYNGLTSPQIISGLTVGTQYYFKVFVRFNADYSLGVQTTATPALVNYYSRGSGLHTDPIWTTTPTGGTLQTIVSLGGMLVDRGMVIQNGHTIQLNASGAAVAVRELIVNTGGTFTATGVLPADNKFLAVHGNITNNGTIGTGATYNPVCFNIEGISTTISGTGITNVGRIRKSFNTNVTSNLIINQNVNVRTSGDGAVYNNSDNTTFNVTVNTGRTLTLTDATGGLAVSGFDGLTGGTRNGTITINGTLNVGGTTYARTANVSAAASIFIGSTGTLNTKNLIVNTSTGNGFGFIVNGNLNVTGSMNVVAGNFAPTVGGNINVSGILLVTAGTFNPNNKLTIVSNSGTTGMIDGAGAGTIIGDVTVQRRLVYVSGRSATHYLSKPVNNSNTVSQDYSDDFSVVGSPSNYVYNTNTGVTQPTVFPTTWVWDETLTDATTPGWANARNLVLTQGQGFSASVLLTGIIDAIGAPNNGSVSKSITRTDNDGFNLIGNPYPSPLKFNDLVAANSGLIFPFLYIWNPAINNYAVYNGTTWNNNPAGAFSSDVISHSQSFFVIAQSSGSINYTNAMRTTNQSSHFFSEPYAAVRLEVSLNGNSDEVVINSQFESTDNFDSFIDAKKLLSTHASTEIQAFTLSSDNMPLAINSLGSIQNQIVPLQVISTIGGEVKIKLNLSELGSSYNELYLEDATLGKMVDLKRNETYTASIGQGNSGSRFFLHFSKPTETILSNDVKVYAVNNTIFTNLSSEANGTLELLDLLGKTVYSTTFSGKSGRLSFQLPYLTSGTYIVKLVENGKIINQKVVLN